MPAVRIVSALPESELRGLIREVLRGMKVRFTERDSAFFTERGAILVSECGKTHFGLTLHEVIVHDEAIGEEIRKRLMIKRAGG